RRDEGVAGERPAAGRRLTETEQLTPVTPAALARVAPRKRPGIAIALALLLSPVFAMLYLGRAARGLAYLGGLLVLAIVWIAFAIPEFLVWPVLCVVYLAGAIDANRLAGRTEPEAIRWFSRWYGLTAII